MQEQLVYLIGNAFRIYIYFKLLNTMFGTAKVKQIWIIICRQNKKIGVINMKKIILKYGGMLAALAMVFTTLTVNSTCTWMTYQEELPDTAKKLRKF